MLDLFLKWPKISTDTRKIEKDSIFFALKGANFNGNHFAVKAIEAGAKFAVIDDKEVYTNSILQSKLILVNDVLSSLQKLASDYRDYLNIPILAITGSNGKTTSKELIATVLETKYKIHFTQGNLNNHIGVPLTILSCPRNIEIMVLEMGANHQGEIDQLSLIAKPNFGVITNIGKAHLEGFGGPEGVIKGKSELYRYLSLNGGTVFVNEEDPILINNLPPNIKFQGYKPSQFLSKRSNTDSVFYKYKNEEYATHFVGQINVTNIALALSIGKYFEVDDRSMIKAINTYLPNNNRSQKIVHNGVNFILDAYNSNPSSLIVTLTSFLEGSGQDDNKVVVLGDMLELGQYAREEHLNIIQYLKKIDMKNVIFIGPIFKSLKSEMNNDYMVFTSVDEAKINIDITKYVGKKVLLKGSRGLTLERLIH